MPKAKPENILLKHVDGVVMGDDILYAEKGHVEFFMDEHGLQWAKFIAKNGPNAWKQHCVPRERITAVVLRDNHYTREAPKDEGK